MKFVFLSILYKFSGWKFQPLHGHLGKKVQSLFNDQLLVIESDVGDGPVFVESCRMTCLLGKQHFALIVKINDHKRSEWGKPSPTGHFPIRENARVSSGWVLRSVACRSGSQSGFSLFCPVLDNPVSSSCPFKPWPAPVRPFKSRAYLTQLPNHFRFLPSGGLHRTQHNRSAASRRHSTHQWNGQANSLWLVGYAGSSVEMF